MRRCVAGRTSSGEPSAPSIGMWPMRRPVFSPVPDAIISSSVNSVPSNRMTSARESRSRKACVTAAVPGVHAGLPQLRDPDNLVYFREEVGGFCMGGYERNPAPWSLEGVPSMERPPLTRYGRVVVSILP